MPPRLCEQRKDRRENQCRHQENADANNVGFLGSERDG